MLDKMLRMAAAAGFMLAGVTLASVAVSQSQSVTPAGHSAHPVAHRNGVGTRGRHPRVGHNDARRALDTAPGALGARGGKSHFAEILPGARWDPCSPVHFEFNPDNAPRGAVRDLRDALNRLDEATHLHLVVDGRTDTVDRSWQQVTGRPVLVNWGSEGDGVLDDGAAATAKPAAWRNADGQWVITTGQVTFSVGQDHYYRPGFGTYGSRVALYMHELSHILGLGHVTDPNQLMFESVSATRDLGAGDLEGLREFTSGPCRQAP